MCYRGISDIIYLFNIEDLETCGDVGIETPWVRFAFTVDNIKLGVQ